MQAKCVGSVTRVEPYILIDGIYYGTWSGYCVMMNINEIILTFRTDKGVRGLNIPVQITVSKGQITVDTI